MKSWVKMIQLWLTALVVILLIDEYMKEGYWFKPEDISNTNITHEKIILALIGILALIHTVNLLKSPMRAKLSELESRC